MKTLVFLMVVLMAIPSYGPDSSYKSQKQKPSN